MLDAESAHLTGTGARIEIGSAGGFLRDFDPSILSTDVRPGPGVAVLATSERLPFRSGSVRTIFAKDCLHHIPDIEQLFEETRRVCVPGGGLVCYEPYWSPLARVVYRYLHPEDFDPKVESWAFTSDDPLTAANQALPYLVLRRDREKFESMFPDLEIIEVSTLNGPSYLLSGGISSPKLLPGRALLSLQRLEGRSKWWRRWAALHILVVFRRRA